MFLQRRFPYTPLFYVHLLIALSLGTVLSFILIFLEPVGITDMDGFFGNAYKMGYGISIAIGYMISHFLGNFFFSKTSRWIWGDEIVFQIGCGLLGITLAYLYHDLIINQQAYSMTMYLGFLLYLALPIFPILAAPTLFLRYFLVQSINKSKLKEEGGPFSNKGQEYLHLTGENQKDKLIIAKNAIAYARSIENYVQLFYVENGNLKNKMFRSTLLNIKHQVNFLVQVHRSYMINPLQPFELRGNSQKSVLFLDSLETTVPVSRSYYTATKEALPSVTKS